VHRPPTSRRRTFSSEDGDTASGQHHEISPRATLRHDYGFLAHQGGEQGADRQYQDHRARDLSYPDTAEQGSQTRETSSISCSARIRGALAAGCLRGIFSLVRVPKVRMVNHMGRSAHSAPSPRESLVCSIEGTDWGKSTAIRLRENYYQNANRLADDRPRRTRPSNAMFVMMKRARHSASP